MKKKTVFFTLSALSCRTGLCAGNAAQINYPDWNLEPDASLSSGFNPCRVDAYG